MSLDLELDDAQRAIADTVAQFARAQRPPSGEVGHAFSRPAWVALGELGVLALGSEEGEGGALEIVAAMESLGAAGFPGPLAASFFATQVLPRAERAAVASGQALVSLGTPPLMPFAPLADLFLEQAGEAAFLARSAGAIDAVETLGGEPWGRARVERSTPLEGVERARCVFDVALAAQLCGAADALLGLACEHARTRTQFGSAIGGFQAVAHPLAEVSIGLGGARSLARAAAWGLDAGGQGAPLRAAGARLAARRAALRAVHVAHQCHGALGITLEAGLFRLSRLVRQLASLDGCDRARETLLEDLGLGLDLAPSRGDA